MSIVKASAKGVKISPRKVSVVAALVRGRRVEDAVTILEHTPRRAALPVRKVIESAKANADNNHDIKPETLTISHISVVPGPRLKRYRPAARGRALPYQLKSSHIFVEVTGDKREKKPTAAKAVEGKPAAKKADSKKPTTKETKNA
jgi:large subunit ribosomal protein L22